MSSSVTSKLWLPRSRATSMSSSLIAEAIQVASRWLTRPVRAVTSPPPPRRGTSSPSSSRSNVAGARFEKRTRGGSDVMRSPGRYAARLAVLHLERDAALLAADERPGLPERLGDRQAEALPGRLLDHHVGLRLEGVHLDRPDIVEVVEDVDVGVTVRVGHGRVEELPALGVVGGHRADQRELHLGHVLRHLTVRVDH